MIINFEQFELMKKVHVDLIENKKLKLLPLFAKEHGVSIIDLKKALISLEKIGFISKLSFSGNAFSVEWVKKEKISTEYLMCEKDYLLISPERLNVLDEKTQREIESLKEKISLLNEKLKEARRDLNAYAKYGKPFKEIVERASLTHGEGTKI